MGNILTPRVRFTWDISYDCNFRCSYCFFNGKWEEYKSRTVYLSVPEWVKYWKAVYDKYGPIFLIITGGEPFLYPGFIDLIEKLSPFCFHINISTNGTGDLKKFAEAINPNNVSLSLSYQQEFDSIENFIGKVKFVRNHKFQGCLNLVAYPPFLDSLENDKRKLRKETQEEFKVIAFFGTWNGKEYPDSYTPEQRKLIGLTEDWFLKIKRKNNLCNAGHTSALLFPNGKVARCGQIGERFIIGDFFDHDFMLYDRPLLCDVDSCPCSEYSVIGDENAREETASFVFEPTEKAGLGSDVSDRVKKLDEAVGSLESEENLETVDDLLVFNRSLSDLSNKVSFAWDVHYKCNFRCPYCWFFDNWAQQAKRNLYLSIDEWIVCWRRIFDQYGETRIAITGGEPFLYPNFIELIKELSKLHIVKITTNMSGNIEKFVQEISPKRAYLDLNFHSAFVKDINDFIRKVKILHGAGFDAGVCYLAYPPQINMINYYKQKFEESDIRFALAAFWGKYQNKQYPEAYSEEEKEIIKPFLGDPNRINYHLGGMNPQGRLCNAGYKYANIHGDGKVVRCAQYSGQSIGNIINVDFSLFLEPRPCEQNICPGNEYDNIVSC